MLVELFFNRSSSVDEPAPRYDKVAESQSRFHLVVRVCIRRDSVSLPHCDPHSLRDAIARMKDDLIPV